MHNDHFHHHSVFPVSVTTVLNSRQVHMRSSWVLGINLTMRNFNVCSRLALILWLKMILKENVILPFPGSVFFFELKEHRIHCQIWSTQVEPNKKRLSKLSYTILIFLLESFALKKKKDKTSATDSFVWTGSIHKSDFVVLVRLNLSAMFGWSS